MRSRSLFVLAVVAFAISLSFALHEYHRMRKAAARAATAPEPFIAPTRKRPLARAPKAPAASLSAPARESDGRLAALFQTAPKGPGGVPLIRPEKLFADYPELRAKYVAAASARMADLLAPYAVEEGLSPEQTQRLWDIFAQREKSWADIQAAASSQEQPDTVPDIGAQNATPNEQREQALIALLGPAAYERLGEYRKNLDSRAGLYRLNALVEASLASSDPISSGKMSQLAKLVAKNGIYSSRRNSPRPGEEAFAMVRREAQEILSPGQLDIFELLLDLRQLQAAKAANR